MDQLILEITMDQADKELDSLTRQYDQIADPTTGSLKQQTDLQTLYQDMMDKAETDLNDRLLNVKLPLVVAGTLGSPPGPYPLAVIEPYPVTAPQLSNWAIKDIPGGTPVYAYTKDLVTLWVPGGPGANGTEPNLGNYATTRVLVIPTSNGSVFQLSLKTGTYPITVRSIYIGTRDGITQDVLAGTNTEITFNGGDTEIQINPGETVVSDWITFNLISATEYFVSLYWEGQSGILSGYVYKFTGGTQFWQNGDHAATEVWAGAGASVGNAWFTSKIEGWDTTSGPGWDSDVLLTNNINDWDKIRPLIYSKPFGTQATIKALNKAKSLIGTRKNQIAARNPSLIHFKTYTITALFDSGCTIVPGTTDVEYGNSQQFAFTGGSYIMVDGVKINSVAPYTFTNVTAIHTIKVFI